VAVCPGITVADADGAESEKSVPWPLSTAVCGLPAALSLMTSDPLAAPLAVGLNATLMAQLAPTATLAKQLLV
jgi:hypothetical protein